MKVEIDKEVPAFRGYAAERTRGLFNVDQEKGRRFTASWELPVEDIEGGWQIGLVVGPSGTGKTSLGEELVNGKEFKWLSHRWPKDKPVVEALKGDYDAVTGALSQVGLGDVPAWLRPYAVLSNGERFRADLARLVLESGVGTRVVVDEFTSVVDRQVARVGAGAFGKAWRRGSGRMAVLLTCHDDVAEWLQPDWIFYTETGEFFRVEKDKRAESSKPKPTGEVVGTVQI